MGYELSKPMLRAELEADLKRFVHITCLVSICRASCIPCQVAIYMESYTLLYAFMIIYMFVSYI